MSVPSLVDCCLECIKRAPKYRTTEGLLSIYATLDSGNPQYEQVRAFAKRALLDRYPMLVERYGIDEMRLIFDPEDVEVFERERQGRLEVKKVFSSLKGTVLEPAGAKLAPRDDGSYPLEVLLQGASWPEGIDCSKREQYLSDSEFESVFKMSKADFAQKDKFVRMRMKKEHRLF
jgi:hypothetical protein